MMAEQARAAVAAARAAACTLTDSDGTALRTLPEHADLTDLQERYSAFRAARGDDNRAGLRLADRLVMAGLELLEFRGRHFIGQPPSEVRHERYNLQQARPTCEAVPSTTRTPLGGRGHMRLASKQSSWQVAVDAPMNLNFALFVRDAAGLAPKGPSPAPLARAEAPRAGRLSGGRRAEAERAWVDWWAALIQDNRRRGANGRGAPSLVGFEPPEFRSLAETPGLRMACQATWPAFRGWWSPPDGHIHRQQELVQSAGVDPGQVVQDLERQRGRPAIGFSLGIDVVESGDRYARRHGDHYAVVAASLWRDADAALAVLRDLIEPLV
jgi:hypothetical protein